MVLWATWGTDNRGTDNQGTDYQETDNHDYLIGTRHVQGLESGDGSYTPKQ